MKKVLLSVLSLAFAFLTLSLFAQTKVDVFTVDVAKSKINWVGSTIAGSSHTGVIPLKKGSLMFSDKQLKSGDFVIDVTGIQVTDLTGDRAARLENHLKSADFFEIEKFPEAVFKIIKIEGVDEHVQVTGELKIRDVAKTITFPATVTKNQNQVVAIAKGVKFNRTDFGVKYRSGSFFSGLGDKAISDEIHIDIELVAKK